MIWDMMEIVDGHGWAGRKHASTLPFIVEADIQHTAPSLSALSERVVL